MPKDALHAIETHVLLTVRNLVDFRQLGYTLIKSSTLVKICQQMTF